MAESFSTYIERKLKSGYTVKQAPNTKNLFCVVQKGHIEDIRCRDELGRIIYFKEHEPETRTRENIVAALRRAGAIRERTRSSDHSRRPTKSVSHKEPKNAVIIAQETLRDSLASPRERALARNYLELFESHKAVRALAQKLGHRLKELEKLID